MKLSADILILGSGYSSLILQHQLKKLGVTNFISVDKGYNHGFTGNDYIVFTKNKFDFTLGEVNVVTEKTSSGSRCFDEEYSEKVYNKKIQLKTFNDQGQGESKTETIGYEISSEFLLKQAQVYGNVEINNIDVSSQKAYGKVLHLREDVEISYRFLVNTIELTRFAKLCGINLLKKFNMFASYFPIGIKREPALEVLENSMHIEYISDPNIPFYRKQHHRGSIYYEYCINKPLNGINFNSVVVPGKFTKIDESTLGSVYDYMNNNDIFLFGRFAVWQPDFLLDHIMAIEEDSKCEFNFQKQTKLFYEVIR